MRYLVTGGLGVVGSRFVELMAEDGHEITVIDSAEEPRNLWMEDVLNRKYDNVSIIKKRIERADFLHLLKSCDYCFHAAAHTGIPHSSQDPNDDWVTNVDGTRVILEALRQMESPIPTVMLSSVKPYKISHIPTMPWHDKTLWDLNIEGIDESFPLEPDEPYAASKMAQSALAMAYGRSYDLPIVVLRCSNLYGDAPCHGSRHGWLTWFCIAAVLGWAIELQGTGRQTRDMLFSDDVTAAGLACFENMDSLKGNVYNIGGGRNNIISCKEALQLIDKILGRSIDVKIGPGRKNEDMLFYTNHNKFSEATGWKPTVNVKRGVTRILEWAEQNAEILKVIYDFEIKPGMRNGH